MSDRPVTSRPVLAITGGSSGIGRCTAALFARRGWNVGLIARGEAGLEAALADVRRAGGSGCMVAADVSDAEALERAAAEIEQKLGPIQAWVNGAGASAYGRFMDLPEEDYRRVTQVTYLGVVNGTRVALRRMQPRNHGTILNVGSAVALRAVPLQSAYSAAKYAVAGFTEAVRAELLHDSSRVHLGIVHPPSTNTPFFNHAASRLEDGVPRPPPPVYEPEIVADAIHLAITERRREVQVGGQTVALGMANTVMPGVLDWALGRFGQGMQVSHSGRAGARREETLFQPSAVPSPVHGAFGQEAMRRSAQMSLNRSPGLATMLLGLGALGVLACLAGPARRS
ncbi:SDR family NAD(P)-dependent oxidoreductase [Roseomonas sp. M0104]|uniref:SDR family NAD(P)-dependent oxidoreductase n=1 Tax=Teichococcus coralli TaxID=2545983 RepID=A0A845B3J6_9PROT|nr:SDR family oxidoreductase [Pseudoroseomonas coralli]MXP62223.1 SDR family NAD(P)-dependent oxidoreductase [Pseudoroseomonas coralli]